jgi:hypothetical protein
MGSLVWMIASAVGRSNAAVLIAEEVNSNLGRREGRMPQARNGRGEKTTGVPVPAYVRNDPQRGQRSGSENIDN